MISSLFQSMRSPGDSNPPQELTTRDLDRRLDRLLEGPTGSRPSISGGDAFHDGGAHGNNAAIWDSTNLITKHCDDDDDDVAARFQNLSEEEMDAHLTEELNRLSMKERERATYDIHGVADTISEDPEFVEVCLAKLEDELVKINVKNAYNLAAKTPEYVRDRKFRLKFLRADCFNAKAAAERIVNCFERKLELFGEVCLGRDIMLSDLTRDELTSLESGYIQLLPGRDRSGRPILCTIRSLLPQMTSKNRLRLCFYLLMAAVEDEDAQKLGIVLIYYAVGQQPVQYKRSSAIKIPQLTRSLPLRIVGVHACYEDPYLKPLLSLGALVTEAYARIRIRFHTGSHMEQQYRLLTFGIPKNIFPVDELGNCQIRNHLEWLRIRKKQEGAVKTVNCITNEVGSSTAKRESPAKTATNNKVDDVQKTLIVIPKSMDVLLGRGKAIKEHIGNLRYQNFIDSNIDRYEGSSKFGKTLVAELILQLVKESSGRFLKQDDDGAGWIEIPDSVARDKVAHAFRNRRKVKGGDARRKGTLAASSESNFLNQNQKELKRQGNPSIGAVEGGYAFMPGGAPGYFGQVAPAQQSTKRSRLQFW